MPCPFLGMLHAFAATLCSFLGMLHAFLGMPYEGEDGIHEESRGLHALHGVLGPSRRRGNECVGSSWERETTRYACVGMPREPQKSLLCVRPRPLGLAIEPRYASRDGGHDLPRDRACMLRDLLHR